MPPLAEIQARFAAAIRDRTLPPPPDVVGRSGESPERRFNVYRNNVHVGLVEALMGTFPVVLRLVGEEFFRGMARVYVGRELPATPVLIDYGGTFPDFIAAFEPARGLGYLPDVARLEWAWHQAYHAAEAEPIDLSAFAEVPSERTVDVVLDLHPSLRLLASPWPVLAIWETNTNDAEVRPVDLSGGPDAAMVLRPTHEVELRRLPEGGLAFVAALVTGSRLGQAFEQAIAMADGFDLAASLHGLLSAGAVVGYRLAPAG